MQPPCQDVGEGVRYVKSVSYGWRVGCCGVSGAGHRTRHRTGVRTPCWARSAVPPRAPVRARRRRRAGGPWMGPLRACAEHGLRSAMAGRVTAPGTVLRVRPAHTTPLHALPLRVGLACATNSKALSGLVFKGGADVSSPSQRYFPHFTCRFHFRHSSPSGCLCSGVPIHG
jgi:hypothetical protein